MMKHRYWGIIFVGLAIRLLRSGEARIVLHSSPEPITQTFDTSTLHTTTIPNLTGILLHGPRHDTQERWIGLMSHNNNYLIGRIYDITNTRMIEWLQEQAHSHEVKIILENEKYMQFGDDFAKLVDNFTDGDITFYPDENLDVVYTHAKAFVGDVRWVIQTANFNNTSWRDNREHFFLSQNEEIRQDLLKLFALDEAKILNPEDVSTQDYTLLAQELDPRLLVCPLNCRTKIEALLESAQQRLWISAQYIMDDRIIALLKIKAAQGLDIRIITNKFDSNRKLVRALNPRSINFDTKIYNHDKLIIADETLLIGSINMSANSLDNNRELGIILTDGELVAQAAEIFAYH